MTYLTIACLATCFGYWLRGVADRWKRENAEDLTGHEQ